MRGGAREGAGRHAEGRKYYKVRLSEGEYRMIALMGGSKMLQDMVKAIQEKEMTIKIDTTKFTEDEQELFIDGWSAAGGYLGDSESPAPWCAPWASDQIIEVTGTDVKDWGRQYWKQCKDEVERLLAEEAERSEDEDFA